jgi:hypothetical protein
MAKKIVTLSESELTGLIKRAISEADNSTENYMTFSNLQQMKRQIDMLLELDENVVDKIIQNGHDWADDHVSEAKNNMDQVFDFFMNETKSKDKENVTADMDQFSLNEEGQLDEKCWDGYKQVGGKKKNGKMVPNCVPTNEASSPAQQAAIAINMKKQGKSPKNETTEEEIDESKNCPTQPAKWASSKAAAKAKFDVYPSAYANGWAAKNYKAKGGGWRKCK